MQEIILFFCFWFGALFTASVFIDYLNYKHNKKQDANGKVGRDKNGRFTKIK